MLISKLKPDKKSIVHFFDNHHEFFTKADVYFTQNNQQLRAVLLLNLKNKGHFYLERIEIFHDDQWTIKKGDHHPYGLTLADNDTVDSFVKQISGTQRNAKNQLERRFRSLVLKLASRMSEELKNYSLIDCKVSEDYLEIITKFDVNGEEISGRIETKNYFPHTANDQELLEGLSKDYIAKTIENLEKHHLIKISSSEPLNIYVTTIPLINPVSEKTYEFDRIYASIHAEGYCQTCKKTVKENIDSSLNIDLNELDQHKEDFIVKVAGDSLVCSECKNVVKKEKIVIKDTNAGKILAVRHMEDLIPFGKMNDLPKRGDLLVSAVNHSVYYHDHEEAFWDAFSYVATNKWELFLEELTEKELEIGLFHLNQVMPQDGSKEQLLAMVKNLELSVQDKQAFWRKANQLVIDYLLFITVFGWNIPEQIAILGFNRAEFIFRNIPVPKELKPYYQVHEAYFTGNASQGFLKLKELTEQQRQQIRNLQKENGRLSEKLGQSYFRIGELEQDSSILSTEVRNKSDILKIQHLKGLIEELKSELSKSNKQFEVQDQIEEVVLTEEPLSQELPTFETLLKDKNILILGGFRNKQFKEEKDYTLYTHDARNLDPAFYELLKTADLIIILTRYISHRAMWEAKEFAILEEKPIFYTTFTNIPTILSEVAKELPKSM